MTHHHLMRYEGISTLNLTDALFRYVLERFRGDYYISTLYGLGTYWDRVLCPKHRWVTPEIRNGDVHVTNSGDEDLDGIPIEVQFGGGKRLLLLSKVPANSTQAVTLD